MTHLRAAFRPFALALCLPLTAGLIVGCDVDSTDSTTAVMSDNQGNIYNFSGLYMSPTTVTGSTNGYGTLVVPAGRQSGEALTWLRLLQYGSVLEAFDSAGMTWEGSLTALQGAIASFRLSGRTTVDTPVEIAGTLAYANQSSTMDAAWVEPNFSGSIFAKATVSPVVTNSPSPTNDNDTTELSLTAGASSVALNGQVVFRAAGCSGSYSWNCSEEFGTFSASGSSATYTRTSGTSNDAVTCSVSCGDETESVTIEFD